MALFSSLVSLPAKEADTLKINGINFRKTRKKHEKNTA